MPSSHLTNWLHLARPPAPTQLDESSVFLGILVVNEPVIKHFVIQPKSFNSWVSLLAGASLDHSTPSRFHAKQPRSLFDVVCGVSHL